MNKQELSMVKHWFFLKDELEYALEDYGDIQKVIEKCKHVIEKSGWKIGDKYYDRAIQLLDYINTKKTNKYKIEVVNKETLEIEKHYIESDDFKFVISSFQNYKKHIINLDKFDIDLKMNIRIEKVDHWYLWINPETVYTRNGGNS